MKRTGLETNVLPLQAQQLTLSQPRGNGQYVEVFEPFVVRRLEQYLHLLRRERPHLLQVHLWGLDGFGRVARMSASMTACLSAL